MRGLPERSFSSPSSRQRGCAGSTGRRRGRWGPGVPPAPRPQRGRGPQPGPRIYRPGRGRAHRHGERAWSAGRRMPGARSDWGADRVHPRPRGWEQRRVRRRRHQRAGRSRQGWRGLAADGHGVLTATAGVCPNPPGVGADERDGVVGVRGQKCTQVRTRRRHEPLTTTRLLLSFRVGRRRRSSHLPLVSRRARRCRELNSCW